MLVLSRQHDETNMIGDDMSVTVVEVRFDKVHLGVNAPKENSVHREEVYDAIRRENCAAAQLKPEVLAGRGRIGPVKGRLSCPIVDATGTTSLQGRDRRCSG